MVFRVIADARITIKLNLKDGLALKEVTSLVPKLLLLWKRQELHFSKELFIWKISLISQVLKNFPNRWHHKESS